MADERSDRPLQGRDLVGLGGLLVGSVVAGLVAGVFIDAKAGTSPVFSLLGIGAGVVLGGVGFWLRVRAALRD